MYFTLDRVGIWGISSFRSEFWSVCEAKKVEKEFEWYDDKKKKKKEKSCDAYAKVFFDFIASWKKKKTSINCLFKIEAS